MNYSPKQIEEIDKEMQVLKDQMFGWKDRYLQACNAREELVKIAKAYHNHLKTSAHTDGEIATYHHINELLNTIEKGV